MSASIGIVGNGGWGTALAVMLHGRGHAVTVWGPFKDEIETIRTAGCNTPYLPDVPLPDGIAWTTERDALAHCDVLVLAVPTRYFRATVGALQGRVPPSCPVVSVAKGLDAETHQRMTEVAAGVLGTTRVAALSGPSHAEEVARGIPTAVVMASEDEGLACALQAMFAAERFRVYSSTDLRGVEYGGALKNVIAIAVGMSDGLGFGDNTRAALITRGLAEMTRLGTALGASADTFSGLSGMGDLIVTCTSRHSRNRGVGERLGRGEPVAAIMGSARQAVEGVWNCDSACALAERHGVDVPVAREVRAIVHEGKSPQDAVRSLLERDLRSE